MSYLCSQAAALPFNTGANRLSMVHPWEDEG